MPFDWKLAFSNGEFAWQDEFSLEQGHIISDLHTFKRFLDAVHVKHCLLKPYCEEERYPLVDSRDLVPSFEAELWEYKNLPGFSMVAFARQLESFSEIFQYDLLYPVMDAVSDAQGAYCPLEPQVFAANTQTLSMRLPEKIQESFREAFKKRDVTALDFLPELMPYLLNLDRAHVFSKDRFGNFHLGGVFASFPSDIDGELKRFGLRSGKFRLGDNELYERNRLFIYQFLMELYGFPVSSERRTSAALFARRLHKLGEHFIIKVLGQSDRTITTIWNDGTHRNYPQVEKIALTCVDPERTDLINTLDKKGFFIDRKRLVVLIRVTYKQHKFNADNVRQDRALSTATQEIIHPLTGELFGNVNIVKDTTTMLLRLSDITKGEYIGRVVYKRTEIVENTDTHEKRLKMLFAWLSKNQRRIISYSDEFFYGITKALDLYLKNPEHEQAFTQLNELYQEVMSTYAYIRQARQVGALEDIIARQYKGEKLSYSRMLQEAVALLHDMSFTLGTYFAPLIDHVLHITNSLIHNRYLVRTYIECQDDKLTPAGVEIRKNYGKIIGLYDKFTAFKKSRKETSQKP